MFKEVREGCLERKRSQNYLPDNMPLLTKER